MQSRVERAEQVQLKSVTAKATTQKQKEKTQSAKQAKTGTGISTGIREKEQQEEKSSEILAREVAAMLATLSRSPKQKGKRKRETPMYFKARRSTRIKVGRPKPQSKEPMTIEDATTKQKKESHSKITINYE